MEVTTHDSDIVIPPRIRPRARSAERAQVNITVDPAFRDDLDTAAQQRGMTRTEFVAELLLCAMARLAPLPRPGKVTRRS